MRRVIPPALVLLIASAGSAWPQPADEVVVYRCVDASGHVTLGDTPCPPGSTGQARSLQRPGAVPVPLTTAAPAPSTPAPESEPPLPVIVQVRTPQPMYECLTPDGERYTSDSSEGNPRWAPLWTLGHRGNWRRPGVDAGRSDMREAGSVWRNVGTSPPERRPIDAGTRPRPGIATGPGTWIRDTCHALPQAEVCDRLRDRRDAVRRRFFNAQETERNTLRTEERGINARLAADCR